MVRLVGKGNIRTDNEDIWKLVQSREDEEIEQIVNRKS